MTNLLNILSTIGVLVLGPLVVYWWAWWFALGYHTGKYRAFEHYTKQADKALRKGLMP